MFLKDDHDYGKRITEGKSGCRRPAMRLPQWLSRRKTKVCWATVESMNTEKNSIFLGCISYIKLIGLFDCGNKDYFKVFGPSNGV